MAIEVTDRPETLRLAWRRPDPAGPVTLAADLTRMVEHHDPATGRYDAQRETLATTLALPEVAEVIGEMLPGLVAERDAASADLATAIAAHARALEQQAAEADAALAALATAHTEAEAERLADYTAALAAKDEEVDAAHAAHAAALAAKDEEAAAARAAHDAALAAKDEEAAAARAAHAAALAVKDEEAAAARAALEERHAAELAAQLGAADEARAQLEARIAELTAPPSEPVVTMAQARRALRRAGLLEKVQRAVETLGGEVLDAWEYENRVRRSSPLLAVLIADVGLTDSDVDELFALAASID